MIVYISTYNRQYCRFILTFSILKITMALMKFAFFFLTLLALCEAYHARHLQDVFINKRVDRRSPSKGVIQMVTQGYKTTASGRHVKAPPPPPKAAPSKGEETYGRDNPKAPQSQSVAPPQVQTNCTTYNLTGPNDAPSKGETTYGQDNPRKEPSTSITPPQDQDDCPTCDAPSEGETTYGQDNSKKEPSTSITPPQVQTNCATTYKLRGPINDAFSQGGTTYSRDNPKREPSTSVAPHKSILIVTDTTLRDQMMYPRKVRKLSVKITQKDRRQ